MWIVKVIILKYKKISYKASNTFQIFYNFKALEQVYQK